jgi:hypothetical protein
LYPKLFETPVDKGLSPLLKDQDVRLLSKSQSTPLLSRNQDAPRPFIFIPPLPNMDSNFMRARDDLLRWRLRVQAGESVIFGLSLLGDAIQELAYVIYAISSMAQSGLGAERASFALEMVACLDAQGNREIIYTPETTRIPPPEKYQTTLGTLTQARLSQLISKDEVTLRFITPTRNRVKGKVADSVDFARLVSMLSRRLSLLVEIHGDAPLNYDYKTMIGGAREVAARASSLRLMALERFSNRRKGKLELDGFMGDICFAGPAVQELLPLLAAGEFLHVGSGTAFGLGRYYIVT